MIEHYGEYEIKILTIAFYLLLTVVFFHSSSVHSADPLSEPSQELLLEQSQEALTAPLAQQSQKPLADQRPNIPAKYKQELYASQGQDPSEVLTIVGLRENLPFSFILPDGTFTGLYIEFWKLWSKTNNVPVRFVMAPLQDSLELVKQKNTIHSGLFRTDAREEWADFSLAIHNVDTGIIYNRSISSKSKLRDLRYLVISAQKNSYQELYVKEKYPEINLSTFNNLDEGIEQLVDNKIQAVIAELPSAFAHIAKKGLSGVFTISDEVIVSNNVFALMAKGQPELLAKINTGIENIPINKIIDLEKKWQPRLKPFFETESTVSTLTGAERKWLSQHASFSLGIDSMWAPFESLNELGEHSGITADYIKYAEKELNIHFTPTIGNTWYENFEQFNQGKIDIMSAVFYTEERAKTINYTNAYFDIPSVLVIKKNAFYAENLASLAGKKLGVVEGYVFKNLIHQDHPKIDIVDVNSVEDGLIKLQSGEIDAFIDSIAVINYEINENEINDLVITSFTPYTLELNMAVREGLEPLVPILNKTFAAMTEKQKSAIANNWLSIHVQSGTKLSTIIAWVLPITSLLILIIVIFFRMNKRLKVEIEARVVNEQKRVRAQQDLATQKAAMDQHSLVYVTDVNGIITYVNNKFCASSGYSRKELIGQNHDILNPSDHSKDYWRNMLLGVSKDEFWHDEVRNKAKDGQLYWVDTTIVPLYDNQQKLSGFTSISTDITHQKEIIIRLAEAKKQAEEANESKTNFLANMSHEIRTPMNGVIGMTNLLLDTPLSAQQKDFAKTVKHSAESLLNVINDILDYSKVEAGMLELEPLEFDLVVLLHQLGSGLAFQAHNKGLELICPANLIPPQSFIGDPGRIRQILNNLVGNAIKFTKQGEVSVHCKVEKCTLHTSTLLFEVTDTGIGLTAEEQLTLFERFSQADGSTTRKYGGTGLGLSISKQLVELMGGDIGIESVKGEGSKFWFTVNVANSNKKLPETSYESLQEHKIIVVETNSTNRTLLGQLLTNWQVEHTLLDSPKLALAELKAAANKKAPYHIGILDMQMSEIDAFELAAKIKAEPAVSALRLLMLTSQGKRGDTEKLKAAGFNGYLNKPIEQSILYNSLMNIADINSPEPSLVTAYSAREYPQFKARILVVEDNPVNQKVAQGLLSKFGVQVDLAANGQEALDSLEHLPFDLVLMDCQMPIMDGYEASQKIRLEDSKVLNRAIPIIAMTANSMEGDREKCLASGMDDFISKPVNPNKLQEALKRWLSESN